eukprot:3941727-Rhodomonas_salina.7
MSGPNCTQRGHTVRIKGKQPDCGSLSLMSEGRIRTFTRGRVASCGCPTSAPARGPGPLSVLGIAARMRGTIGGMLPLGVSKSSAK